MAKVSLSAVAPIKSIDAKVITIEDKEINIVQYLSTEKKIDFIEDVMSRVFDNTGLSSPVRVEVYFYLNLIRYYTDISITETMMKNAAKTYDILEMNNIIDVIIENIPEDEFNTLFDYVTESIEHFETYNFSFAGTLKNVGTDYNNTNVDVEGLIGQLTEIESSEVLTSVIERLG